MMTQCSDVHKLWHGLHSRRSGILRSNSSLLHCNFYQHEKSLRREAEIRLRFDLPGDSHAEP